MPFIFSFLTSSLSKYLYIALICASLVFGFYSLTNKYEAIGYNKAKSEDIEFLLKKEQEFRLKEKQYNETLMKALNEREIANAKLAGIFNSNKSAIFGLRQQIDQFNRSMPSNSIAANADRITALSSVFSECIGAYSDMAEQADKHYQDSKLMLKGWPK